MNLLFLPRFVVVFTLKSQYVVLLSFVSCCLHPSPSSAIRSLPVLMYSWSWLERFIGKCLTLCICCGECFSKYLGTWVRRKSGYFCLSVCGRTRYVSQYSGTDSTSERSQIFLCRLGTLLQVSQWCVLSGSEILHWQMQDGACLLQYETQAATHVTNKQIVNWPLWQVCC